MCFFYLIQFNLIYFYRLCRYETVLYIKYFVISGCLPNTTLQTIYRDTYFFVCFTQIRPELAFTANTKWKCFQLNQYAVTRLTDTIYTSGTYILLGRCWILWLNEWFCSEVYIAHHVTLTVKPWQQADTRDKKGI